MLTVNKFLVILRKNQINKCFNCKAYGSLLLLAILFLFAIDTTKAQDRIELGGFIGTSYYFGDLNPSRQFYRPHLAIGGIGRYAYSDRLALKATALYGKISGAYSPDLNYKDLRQPAQQIGDPEYAFQNVVGDVSVQAEFNFLSYDHKFISSTNFTPYLSVGLGTTFYNRKSGDAGNLTSKPTFILSLPFGVGVKYKVNKWVRVGAEWSFRKTFVDDLDYEGPGDIDPSDPYGFGNTVTHNNDWISYAGVYVTISMLKRKSSCNGGY